MSNDSSNKTDMTDVSYADITESNRQKLTAMEQELQEETGEKIALVAYHI